MITNIPFFIFGDDKPAPYTLPDWEQRKSTKVTPEKPDLSRITVPDIFSNEEKKKKIEEIL